MKHIYRITYPNGKIYVGKDLTGTLNYFGSADTSLIEGDFSPEEMADFTIRKQILWSSKDAPDSEVNKKEIQYILQEGANDPSRGYNRWPKWKGSADDRDNSLLRGARTTSVAEEYYHSDVNIYLTIAREAAQTMTEELKKRILPRPDGQPGFVKIFDPNRTSFKNAFITIVFCGMYLDAALHIQLVRTLGKSRAKALDNTTYEEKLQRLGCTENSIMESVERFRKSRREVVHEKALTEDTSLKVAQEEATFSIELIEKIHTWFGTR